MNKGEFYSRGMSVIGLMIGIALLAISVTGAIRVMDEITRAQLKLNTENLVDQVQRISEMMTLHLNRGGGKNADIEVKGIQLCSLQNTDALCSGYQPTSQNFCLSVPSSIYQGANEKVNVTGFRLFNGVLSQRDVVDVNMAAFDHNTFCQNNSEWLDLNNVQDFEFTNIRLCRFQANTLADVTQDYEQQCSTVIESDLTPNMFWVALFNAKIGSAQSNNLYEEIRIIHLINRVRVRIGS